MVTLELALQILTLIPPLQFGTPAAPAAQPEGTGTLLIMGCRPDESVTAFPGPHQAVAGADGIARIEVPAQKSDDVSYLITTSAGESRIHGTINTGENLSGVCP